MENHDFTTEDPVEPTVGGQYDLCALTFAWWEYGGAPIQALGYHWESYFDSGCVYQGAQEGIYPTFWISAND